MPFSFEIEVQDALREAFADSDVTTDSVPMRKVPSHESWGWGFATQLALQQGRGKDGAQALAQEVAGRIESWQRFQRAEAVNGYVNVYVGVAAAAASVLGAIATEGDHYGAGATKGTRIMLEYSCPNTHKEFHIGHLRNTAFGNAIARLLRFGGYDVTVDNYIGDIGAHVIRCLWCLRKYHAQETPPEDRLDWLGKIYAEASQRLETEPDAKEEIQALFRLWETGDRDLMELWRETKQWSLDELHRIYRQLDVHFDLWFYESEVEPEGNAVARELIERGIAEYSEGLPIVRLPGNLGVLPVLRSDGTSLYQTKELGLSIKKFRDYPIDQSIVITSVSEILYFKQVYKVLELYGFEHAGDLTHLPYERVNLPEGKMGSRFGNIITYEDLAADAIERVSAIVAEKNPGLSPEERAVVAEQVAISALKFAMVSVGNTSTITFDWERVLDFDGFAGPYLQYAYVRAKRILERADEGARGQGPGAGVEMELVEREVLEVLADFPSQIARAVDQRSPVTVAAYVHSLAKKFSEFYQTCQVLQEPDAGKRQFRLQLVDAVRQVLANGLTLLGVSLPESM